VQSVPGVAGGYRLGRGQALPPLLLDDDEAIAVVVSLRSAASHSVAGLSDASVSALAKLDQVLPARLRERTAAAAVVERFSPTSGVVSDAGDGRCLLTTGADSLELLTFYLLAMDADFTVLEPPELTEFISATAGRLRRACESCAAGA
jgi:predicted DNA-binding transcriptional regulator YafY